MKHGLALCCNTTPIYGFGEGISSNFSCPVCNKKVGGWSRNIEWIASLWNKKQGQAYLTDEIDIATGYRKQFKQPNMKLDLDGWRYATLSFSTHLPYGDRREQEFDFSLFQTDRTDYELLHSKEGWEFIINDSRCFKKFKLRNYEGKEVEFDLPTFKKRYSEPFQVYVNASYCTDGSCWYRLNISAYNYKWIKIFQDKLGELFPIKTEI